MLFFLVIKLVIFDNVVFIYEYEKDENIELGKKKIFWIYYRIIN